jgi:unsaturated rhamnogalacturonyl hydrolase
MKIITFVLFVLLQVSAANGQRIPYSQRMAQTVIKLWKDSLPTGNKWTYDQGVILKGFEGISQDTGDKTYFDFIKIGMDKFVQDDGSIRTYRQQEYNLITL